MPVKVGLKVIEKWNDSMEKAVCRYESEETEKGQIVFYGPSNFTRWSTRYGMKPLRECILGKSGKQCCVNRGFGSSCAEHQLYYYPRMIRPIEPKVLVYSSFGNGSAFGYTSEETWELAQRVITYAQTDFPGIHIYLCGPNPRCNMTKETEAERRAYDALLEKFASENENCFFVSALDHEPFYRDDIRVEDGVHFNAEGYKRYAQLFREALKDELEKF